MVTCIGTPSRTGAVPRLFPRGEFPIAEVSRQKAQGRRDEHQCSREETRMKYVVTALVTSAVTLGILAVAHRTAIGRKLLGF